MVSQGVQGQLALLGLTICFLGSALVQANVIHTTVQPAANQSPSVGNEMADIGPPAAAPPAAHDNIGPAGSAANPSAPPAAAPGAPGAAAPPAAAGAAGAAAAPAEASKELPSTVSPAPAAPSTGAPASHHQLPTTLAPAATASSLAPVAPTGSQSTVLPATVAAANHHLSTALPAAPIAIHATVVTAAPAVALHSSAMPSVVVSHSTGLPVAVHVASGDQIAPNASKAVCNRFCDYMKPICDSVSKISPKQLFKIQQQFKQFVQRTNGKLSFCFVEHYSFDPTFKVVSQHELNTICASRKSAHTGKGSFQAFESCANSNWDASLDKDLASIAEARTQAQTHAHPASEAAVATNIEHEDTELSIINAVVNKVLGASGALNEKNSDVKVIDVTGGGAKTTVKPTLAPVAGLSTVAPPANANSTGSAAGAKTKSLLADPKNTVMVFVDDTKTTTTLAPVLTSSSAPAPPTAAVAATGNNQTVSSSLNETNSTLVISHNSTTTIKPAVAAALNSTTLSPTVKVHGVHHSSGNATTPLPAVLSTKAPASVVPANATTTLKPHHSGNSTAGVASTVSPTTAKPSGPGNATVALSTEAPAAAAAANTTTTLAPGKKVTTAAPSSSSSPAHTTSASKSTLAPNSTTPLSKSTTLAPTKVATTVAPAAGNKTTSTTVAAKAARPIETLEQILARQEKEKAVLEKKLKIERQKAIKQLEKKEDEMDAKSKVKQAKPARNSADAKLHQMEHERQMAMDPVGHTIKHQQYELNKQQKLAAKKQQ